MFYNFYQSSFFDNDEIIDIKVYGPYILALSIAGPWFTSNTPASVAITNCLPIKTARKKYFLFLLQRYPRTLLVIERVFYV